MQQDQDEQVPEIDPDDGFAEDVGPNGPLRRFEKALSVEDAIAQADGKRPSGAPAEAQPYDFITYRGAEGLLQVSLGHYPVFAALWAEWARRRGDGKDQGITAFDLAEIIGVGKEKVARVLGLLCKAGVVKKIARATGDRGVRVQYLPKQLGWTLYGIAETLGYGVQLQVGRTVKAWKRVSLEEPIGIFKRAELYKGQTA